VIKNKQRDDHALKFLLCNKREDKPDPMMHWYALYTKPRHEKKVFSALQERQIESYLPMVMRRRQWKDRVKMVEFPLFSGYLFARFDPRDRFTILPLPGMVRIISFLGEPAPIPDWQIESLKIIVEKGGVPEAASFAQIGQPVRVTGGAFSGARGVIVETRQETRLLIQIEGLRQALSVEINRNDVEPV